MGFQIKQQLTLLGYWLLLLLLTSMMLMSLQLPTDKSLLVSCYFLPGAICMHFLQPRLFNGSASKIDVFFSLSGVLVFTMLLVLIAYHQVFPVFRIQEEEHEVILQKSILFNPVFVAFVLTAYALGDRLLNKFLLHYFSPKKECVSFVSDRRSVSLYPNEIVYVESNDTEVWIHASENRKFRNKIPISQWEKLLGADFQRIHRSFLVNANFIDVKEKDSITLTDATTLPISRKYRSN